MIIKAKDALIALDRDMNDPINSIVESFSTIFSFLPNGFYKRIMPRNANKIAIQS